MSPTEADGSLSVSVSAIGEDGTPNHLAATSSSEPVTIGEGECPPTLVESKPSSFRYFVFYIFMLIIGVNLVLCMLLFKPMSYCCQDHGREYFIALDHLADFLPL